MNLNCTECGGLFGQLDWVVCDGCERIVHRLPCGEYELIPQKDAQAQDTGEVTCFFFCNSCIALEFEEEGPQ